MASPPSLHFSVTSDYDEFPQDQAPSLGSKIMAGVIIALFFLTVFLFILHLYCNWFLRPSRRRRSRSARAFPFPHSGLSRAAISLLPTFTFTFDPSSADSQNAGAPPSLECSVCLTDFQRNEKGRALPACKHSFHVDCIDMWLLSHSTCPLCRASVLPPAHPAQDEQQGKSGNEAQEQPSVEIVFNRSASLSLQSAMHASARMLPSPQPCLASSTEKPSPTSSSATKKPLPTSFSATEKPSLTMPSATERTSSRRRMPPITIEIPPWQQAIARMSGPDCVSLPSQLSRWYMSPRDQSCSSQRSMQSSVIRGPSLKRVWSMQAAKTNHWLLQQSPLNSQGAA